MLFILAFTLGEGVGNNLFAASSYTIGYGIRIKIGSVSGITVVIFLWWLEQE